MMLSSKKLLFEEAAKYRDQLDAINIFIDKQIKSKIDFKDRDVIGLATENDIGIVAIIRIRNGRIFSREKISLNGLDNNNSKTIKTILTRFYIDSNFVPEYITLRVKPENESELLIWLNKKRNKRIRFLYPKRGEKEKELSITEKNAKLLLGEWLIKREKIKNSNPKILLQLQSDLNLNKIPRTIEAFDVSHLGGENTVASVVVFQDSKPVKRKYRKYNIKTVTGIDDYSSMDEVVFRRYKRLKKEETKFPDLILIDGGKGQLNAAVSALKRLELGHINIIGLAKKLEEVFVPGNSDPQSIQKQSSGLILLRKIRDEAHRFAIKFQRNKRSKKISKSIFEGISGIGKERAKRLLIEYKNPKSISNTTVEKLSKKTGIPKKFCKNIIRVAKNI